MKEKLISMLLGYIDGAVENLQETLVLLQNGMIENFSTEAAQIANLIKPTAMTILAILVIIEVIDTVTKKGEEMRWEDVARLLIKMLICKNLMEIAPYIMNAMYYSTAKLISTVGATWDGAAIHDTIKAILEAEIPPDGSGVIDMIKSMFTQVVVYIGTFINALVIHIVTLIIRVVVYGRMFELAVLQAFSPLPIAFAGWGETKDIPKKYLLGYFGTCLQGLAMIICFLLFTGIMGQPATMGDFMLYTIALALGMFSSGKWAKDSLGLI